METATFAAGPFWDVEDAFRRLEGVTATRVGYAGGSIAGPSHEQVATGGTGHAEAVEISFDPRRISYETLLEVFWGIHDSAGPEAPAGRHRSVIFIHGATQEAAARESRDRYAAARAGRPPATRILPVPAFYPAEEHHQHYYEKRFG